MQFSATVLKAQNSSSHRLIKPVVAQILVVWIPVLPKLFLL
jgi:hypothetical protein